jgi:hypothetical protein
MKRITILLIIISICYSLSAQNPFAQYGYTKVRIATASNGSYNEFFDNDSLMQIGSVIFNTNTGKIASFIENNTTDILPRPLSVSRWVSPDPLAIKYCNMSPYNYCANNPVKFVDPDGRVIQGVSKDDAKKTLEDLDKIFANDKFANFRGLLALKGKTFNSIGSEALSKALDGKELNADEKALVDMVVNTINSKDVHLVEFANKDDNISSTGQSIMSNALPKALIDPVVSANGGIPASILSAFGGSGITTPTKDGTYSLLIQGLPAGGNSDYFNSSTNSYVNNPGGRAATTGHELFGHGRSLALGRTNASTQQVDAIRTENLILRVMSYGNIQRDGTNHGNLQSVSNPSSLPDYK